MIILLCLNNDIESNLALNLLSDTLTPHEIYINISKWVGHSENNITELQLLESDLPFKVIFPLLNKFSSKGFKNKFKTFEQISKRYNWPLYYIKNINKENDGIKFLKKLKPELIISIRCGQIFKTKAISIPKKGIINLHSAKLPDYRGVIGTFRAMNDGCKKLGTTLHYITNGTIDTGNIIDIHYIKNNKSLIGNIINLYYVGTQMIKNFLQKIESNEVIKCKNQDNTKAKYYSFPKQEDIKKFLNKGYKIINCKDYMQIMSLYTPKDLYANRYKLVYNKTI